MKINTKKVVIEDLFDIFFGYNNLKDISNIMLSLENKYGKDVSLEFNEDKEIRLVKWEKL